MIRMSHYARLLGERAGMGAHEVDLLLHAAPMHDIGKIGIPDQILRKPGRLTAEEWEVMKTHCQIGAVTAVALASLGCKHVQWSMLGKILVSWILTIPTSAVIAAIILWIFRPAVCASCPWS